MDGLFVVLFYPVAVVVKMPQIALGGGIPSLGCLEIKLGRFLIILLYPATLLIAQPLITLGGRIAHPGRLSEQL